MRTNNYNAQLHEADLKNGKSQVISKWGRYITAIEKRQGKTMNFEKRFATAQCLENINDKVQFMKRRGGYLGEATNPQNLGQYLQYAIPITATVVPNLIAMDLFSVQPMENKRGVITYFDIIASKDKGETKAGQVLNSSIMGYQNDPAYTSDRVNDQPLGPEGQTAYGTQDIPLQLNFWPVTLNTVTIEADDGAVIGTADAQGTVTGTGVSGTVTVDGRVALTFDNATTTRPTISYRFDNKSVPTDGPLTHGFTNHPEIELDIKSMPIEAQARTLRAYWAFDSEFELQKEYGANIADIMTTAATSQLATEIDIELTNMLLNQADAGPALTWSQTQPVGVNLVDHYDSFYAVLAKGQQLVNQVARRGRPNYLIVGSEVASVIEVMRKFEGNPEQAANGPYYAGKLGAFDVYVNPNFPPNEFVMGFKGDQMFDAGAIYAPYMPIASTDLITDANFTSKRGWATSYASTIVNNKMFLRGYITD